MSNIFLQHAMSVTGDMQAEVDGADGANVIDRNVFEKFLTVHDALMRIAITNNAMPTDRGRVALDMVKDKCDEADVLELMQKRCHSTSHGRAEEVAEVLARRIEDVLVKMDWENAPAATNSSEDPFPSFIWNEVARVGAGWDGEGGGEVRDEKFGEALMAIVDEAEKRFAERQKSADVLA